MELEDTGGDESSSIWPKSAQNLSPQQLYALSLRVAGKSWTAIASETGAGRRTLFDWSRSPEWREAEHALLRHARLALFLRLSSLVEGACTTLEKALSISYMSDQRLDAAKTVLTTILRLTESEKLPAWDAPRSSAHTAVKDSFK